MLSFLTFIPFYFALKSKSKGMKKLSVLLILFSLLLSVTLNGQDRTTLSYKSKELQKILDQTVDNEKIYGTSFTVKHKDEVWSGSAGNIAEDQQYFIASTTKLFVTAIILQLDSEKKLLLDDKISDYLDADIMAGLHVYKGKDYSNELTINNLLAHTSGLADYYQNKGPSGMSLEDEVVSGIDQFWTFEQAIARTKKMEPLFAPSTPGKAHYSDANFQLLGKIIENITGSSFAENCEVRIFKPLNLTKTYMYADTADTRPIHMYYKNNELNIPKAMTSFGADGGIVSTSAEMLTFIEAFFTGKLFPKEYIAELQEWNKIFSPLRSGVGIHLYKLPKIFSTPAMIGHSGLSGALAYYDPKEDIYVSGTVNQIAYPATSFTVATKLVQRTRSNKKNQLFETVSGIGLGATYSTVANNNGDFRIGPTFTLYKEFRLLKPVSFSAEIVYNQKGERSKEKDANIWSHYIDLPLMLKLNTINNKFGVSGGYSTNFLLFSNKPNNTFHRVEFSVPIGVHYRVSDFLQLYMKYNIGLTGIGKNAYANEGLKNNWFSISLMLLKP